MAVSRSAERIGCGSWVLSLSTLRVPRIGTNDILYSLKTQLNDFHSRFVSPVVSTFSFFAFVVVRFTPSTLQVRLAIAITLFPERVFYHDLLPKLLPLAYGSLCSRPSNQGDLTFLRKTSINHSWHCHLQVLASSRRLCWLLLLSPSVLPPAIPRSLPRRPGLFSLSLASFPPPDLGSTLPVNSDASTVAQERHIGTSVHLSGDVDGPVPPPIRTLYTQCDQTDDGAPGKRANNSRKQPFGRLQV
ncbi:hypothetical protein EDB84DRAFT_556465 [Lactarius hengduanensis]|nr:hypothetical protein EDB84DRAFT_556465 [Lactarius hengduanensis]